MRLLGASSSLTTTVGRLRGFVRKPRLPSGQTAQPQAVLLQKMSLLMRLLQIQAQQQNSRVTLLPATAHTNNSLGCLASAWMRCGAPSTSVPYQVLLCQCAHIQCLTSILPLPEMMKARVEAGLRGLRCLCR